MIRQHPLRTARIAIWQRIEGESGPAFFGKIEPFNLHPIYFHGPSIEAVQEQARNWCNEQADKHETQWQATQERKAQAEARKAAKEAAA